VLEFSGEVTAEHEGRVVRVRGAGDRLIVGVPRVRDAWRLRRGVPRLDGLSRARAVTQRAEMTIEYRVGERPVGRWRTGEKTSFLARVCSRVLGAPMTRVWLRIPR